MPSVTAQNRWSLGRITAKFRLRSSFISPLWVARYRERIIVERSCTVKPPTNATPNTLYTAPYITPVVGCSPKSISLLVTIQRIAPILDTRTTRSCNPFIAWYRSTRTLHPIIEPSLSLTPSPWLLNITSRISSMSKEGFRVEKTTPYKVLSMVSGSSPVIISIPIRATIRSVTPLSYTSGAIQTCR